jgi:hypothetical protein
MVAYWSCVAVGVLLALLTGTPPFGCILTVFLCYWTVRIGVPVQVALCDRFFSNASEIVRLSDDYWAGDKNVKRNDRDNN